MKRLFLILLIFLFVTHTAQEQKSDFDKVYVEAYLEISQKDFKEAIKIADSLFRSTSDPVLQTKSLMLTASLYQQKGNYSRAVNYALRAERIANTANNIGWKTRISGFLTSQYRMLGLYSISEKYADKTVNYCKKIKDSVARNQLMGIMMQEKAYLELDRKNYSSSVKYVRSSQKLLKDIQQDRDFYRTNNAQILGLNYFNLKDYKTSMAYYDSAVVYSKGLAVSYLHGLIYNGIANNLISLDRLSEAEDELHKAEGIASTTQYLQLKHEIYETAQRLYLARKKIDKVETFKIKQDSVKEQLDIETGRFINNTLHDADRENERNSKNSLIKNFLIITTVLLLLAAFTFFFFHLKAEKRTYQRFKAIIAEMNKRKLLKKTGMLEEDKIRIAGSADEKYFMTPLVEVKILDNLQKFENSELYLKSDITLPYLAAFCKTNTKYLSRIINNQKGLDFNNYINTLRINYIVDKLTNEPEYRKYKIAVLADEAGFSSQNKFSTIFKKITSISPSLFIKYLHEQKFNK